MTEGKLSARHCFEEILFTCYIVEAIINKGHCTEQRNLFFFCLCRSTYSLLLNLFTKQALFISVTPAAVSESGQTIHHHDQRGVNNVRRAIPKPDPENKYSKHIVGVVTKPEKQTGWYTVPYVVNFLKSFYVSLFP